MRQLLNAHLRVLEDLSNQLLFERMRGSRLLDGSEPPTAGRFIQCWAVHGRPVTQALDDQGQVWERVWRKATATTPEQTWWEPLVMERRKPETKLEATQ